MSVDSLNELKIAFRSWRSQKRYQREPIPEELLVRARRAVAIHGISAVVKATEFTRSRLANKISVDAMASRHAVTAPSYSRLEVARPTSTAHPLAEAETPLGMKLRIFQFTPETLGLLTGFCGSVGAR
jgi:hypothetical protein